MWSRWKQNISLEQTISEWFMISWSAKWLGSPDVMGDVVTPREALNEDDSRIAKTLWELIDDADIIVGHNCNAFDVPKMNTRFILAGLPRPSPYQKIDTLKTARKHFGFSSNKLDALCTYFGIGNKNETTFSLWSRCLDGEKEALEYMLEYNRQDVIILEDVYMKMRAWMDNHPNTGLYVEDAVSVCHVCGSRNLTSDGSYKYTSVSKFLVKRCLDCNAISRERKTAIGKDERKKLLAPA